MTRREQQGASLITALMLGALALTLALTLAGMSFSHLSVSSRLSNISQARNLAEAVVSQGIERISSTKGEAFLPDSDLKSLSISFGGAPGGLGRLTFDPLVAGPERLPLSTNNLRNDESVAGFGGRVVPPHSVHLVGVGTHRGVVRTIECLIHFPAYKFALSSKGEIFSSGALIVAGADEPADFSPSVHDNLHDADEDDLLPGHVASNNAGASSLVLDPAGTLEIVVTGDLRSHGQIKAREEGAVVDGDEVEGAQEIDLPEIDLAEFDPNNFGGGQILPGWDPRTGPPPPVLNIGGVTQLDGMFRHNGNVVLDKLRMPNDNTGSILWVNGDLTIRDGIHGVGAIFATGDITIEDVDSGPSSLSADHALAVVAGNRLTIHGAGNQNTSYFQGVVAAGADVQFSNVTVAGAAVVGDTKLGGTELGTDNPKLTLTDANFVHLENTVDFEFKMPFGGGAGGLGGDQVGWSVGVAPGYEGTGPTEFINLGPPQAPDEPMSLEHFYDSATDSYRETNWNQWDGFTPYHYDEGTHTRSGSPFYFHKKVPGGYERLPDRSAVIAVLEAAVDEPNHGIYVGTTFHETWDQFFDDPNAPCHNFDQLIDGLIQFYRHDDRLGRDKVLAALNTWYQNHNGQPQESGTFSMDPNQFVQWDSRTKIVLWREL